MPNDAIILYKDIVAILLLIFRNIKSLNLYTCIVKLLANNYLWMWRFLFTLFYGQDLLM